LYHQAQIVFLPDQACMDKIMPPWCLENSVQSPDEENNMLASGKWTNPLQFEVNHHILGFSRDGDFS